MLVKTPFTIFVLALSFFMSCCFALLVLSIVYTLRGKSFGVKYVLAVSNFPTRGAYCTCLASLDLKRDKTAKSLGPAERPLLTSAESTGHLKKKEMISLQGANSRNTEEGLALLAKGMCPKTLRRMEKMPAFVSLEQPPNVLYSSNSAATT